jgi:hypothetical protein
MYVPITGSPHTRCSRDWHSEVRAAPVGFSASSSTSPSTTEGECLSFGLTAGNVDDRDWSVMSKLTREMFGKLFADRGYLSAKLFEKLWQNDIQLITKLKSNMKNKLKLLEDKLLLRKRCLIESVNDFLKNIMAIG